MLHETLKAVETLAADGWDVEVVDLRCLKPLDTDTVLASVARTGRLLVVAETFPYGGVASEVITAVSTHGFELLDAPPQRLTSRDTPIPYHPDLWRAHRPTAHTIAEALRHLLAF
jgi:pyruvate dehydrogenase E1 component beta subunit/2-oxoisovalerate dehydrogenase E1 component beta subunit